MSNTESHRAPGGSTAAAASDRGQGKRRILVVDDERDIVDLVRYNLNKNGYEALVATDGQQALQMAARELPDLASAGLPAVVSAFLSRNQLEHADIDHWVVHPGGRRIVENVQSALELSAEDVATSWDALADHGNIGTPSILYVLKDTIERYKPTPGERGLLVTIGPGVTVGLMLVGW